MEVDSVPQPNGTASTEHAETLPPSQGAKRPRSDGGEGEEEERAEGGSKRTRTDTVSTTTPTQPPSGSGAEVKLSAVKPSTNAESVQVRFLTARFVVRKLVTPPCVCACVCGARAGGGGGTAQAPVSLVSVRTRFSRPLRACSCEG